MNFQIFLLWLLKVQKENMNYRWRLEISASKLLQKIQICYKYLDKHVKIFFTIIFWVSKIEILWKLAKNRGLWKIFGPILGFYTKNSPRNSWSSHFMITLWNQKSRNVRTPCINIFQNSWFCEVNSMFCDFWVFEFTGEIMKCEDHEFRGQFLV